MARLEVAKLGHVALVTPDIEKSYWFWHDVIGLEEVERRGDHIYLRAWGEFEHHSLILISGEQAKVDHIGWKARYPEDVNIYAQYLRTQGVEVQEVEADEEAGQGKAIRFKVPTSHFPFEIYYDMERPVAPEEKRSRLKNQVYKSWSRGISPRRIDHVNVTTSPDPGPTLDWLSEHMGFKMREYIKLNSGLIHAGWVSVTPLVHDIVVMREMIHPGPRFHHVAYYMDNWQDVLRALTILRDHNITPDLGPGQHGITQAFYSYVRDPGSGHRLELFSGGYLIFDPDWEPIEWKEEELVDGLFWWGDKWAPGTGHPMDETTGV
jgi:biphenyl-2,3-diol 1,2-dioxygenase